MLLLLKILVVPTLIVSVTLAGRRWGPRVGGVLASFPLVTGPVLFFLATEQGEIFAAEAARATLVSLIGVAASGLAYSWVCLRAPWWMSLAASWGSFVLLILALHRVCWAALTAFAAALASFMVKSIAEEAGVKMPSFFGYMLYSGLVLIPLFVAVTFLFF